MRGAGKGVGPGREPLMAVPSWLRALFGAVDIANQVHVESRGGLTYVEIDHRMPPHPPRLPDRWLPERWQIRTRIAPLPEGSFLRKARTKIKKAEHRRGRALYCIDLACDEVVAALAYHVHDSPTWPVLITAMALRADRDGDPELFDSSRACMLILKAHVHVIGSKIDRGGEVAYDPDTEPERREAERLGFQRAKAPRSFRGGRYYMLQRATS